MTLPLAMMVPWTCRATVTLDEVPMPTFPLGKHVLRMDVPERLTINQLLVTVFASLME